MKKDNKKDNSSIEEMRTLLLKERITRRVNPQPSKFSSPLIRKEIARLHTKLNTKVNIRAQDEK